MKIDRYLALVLILVFLASISYSFYYSLTPVTDAAAYDRIGWNVARGLGYVIDEENAGNPKVDDAVIRPGPGYEFFLAGTYTVFGRSYEAVWIIHALFRVLTAYFIYKIALLLFRENQHGRRIGLLSAFLFGFSPDLILINGMLLTETASLFLIVLATYYSFVLFEKKSLGFTLLSGFLWSLATLVRPTALLPLLLLFVFLIIKRFRFTHIALFLVPALLLVGGWSLRNTLVYDTPLFTTSVGAWDLWIGNNPDATGGFDKTEEQQAIRQEYHSVELAPIATQKYIEFLTEHPAQFVELQFRKTAMYFSLIRPTGFWSYLKERPLEQIATLGSSALWTGILFVFGISGALYLWMRRRDVKSLLILSFAALQPIAVIPIIVETRYRYALFPFLAVFASLCVISLLYEKRERGALFNVLFLVILFLIFLTSYDLIFNAGEVLTRIENLV